jgi:cell division protein FtsN
MAKYLKTSIVVLVLLATPISLSASGIVSADFLNIGVSAQQASLGGAAAALSNDIASTYFNPAGLSAIEQSGVNFMHNMWYQDISYEFMGAAFPLNSGSTVGFSFSYLHMGKIDVYNIYDQQDGTISPYSMAGMLSYSRAVRPNFYIGLSGKYILEKIAEVEATGFGLDAGAQYALNTFTFGLVANNIGPKMKYETESFSMPSSISLGVSYANLSLPVMIVVGAKVPFAGEASIATGIEYRPASFLALRSGFEGLDGPNASHSANFGLGFELSGVNIDYAFNPGSDLGRTHFFSFTFSFGASREIGFATTRAGVTNEIPAQAELAPAIKEVTLQQAAVAPAVKEEALPQAVVAPAVKEEALPQATAVPAAKEEAPPQAMASSAVKTEASPQVITSPTFKEEAPLQVKAVPAIAKEALPQPKPVPAVQAKEPVIVKKPVNYVVTAGEFKDEKSALRQKDGLSQFGFDSKLEVNNSGTYRVVIVRTKDREKAEKMRGKLKNRGFSCAMITE